MKQYFVWTRDIERMIHKTLSDKSRRLPSNADALVTLFGRTAEASNHYYSLRASMYELSRNWKSIDKSSIYRSLERNKQLWEGVGQIFSALELQKVLVAPSGSIIIPKFGMGGYGFEIIKPTDANYLEAYSSLPGAV